MRIILIKMIFIIFLQKYSAAKISRKSFEATGHSRFSIPF